MLLRAAAVGRAAAWIDAVLEGQTAGFDVLQGLGGFDAGRAALARLRQDIGEVLCLLVEHVRKVHREARLHQADDEAV